MKIILRNLTIDVVIDTALDEYMGECSWSIPGYLVKLGSRCGIPDADEFSYYHDLVEIPYDIDLVIKLLALALERPNRYFKFECHYNNYFWLLHDLTHVRNDVMVESNFELDVSEYAEEMAHKRALDHLVNFGIPITVDINSIGEAFEARFDNDPRLIEYLRSITDNPESITLEAAV